MPRDDEAFEPVLKALAADPAVEPPLAGASFEILRRVEGPFSSVRRIRIQTPAALLHAYVKLLKPRGPGEDELARADRMLAREFDATRALYETMQQDDGLGAVRPIACYPQFRAIVTEEVPGRPWGDLLLDPAATLDTLRPVAERVGRWVRAYQRAGGDRGVVELTERRAYLDERLRLVEGRVLAPGEREHLLERFDALAREIGGPSVPAVAIHADLSPMNLIVDAGGRVTVLDFTMAKAGTACHDLGHIYFHMALLAARHRARREVLHALQREMLRGYDPELSAADPLFRLMLLQHKVCHVAYLAERRVPVLDAAYRWFLRRRWQVCEGLPDGHAGSRVA